MLLLSESLGYKGEDVEHGVVGCNAVKSCRLPVFGLNVSPMSSGLNILGRHLSQRHNLEYHNRHVIPTENLHTTYKEIYI